jgi:hypothetical protein
MLKKIFFFALFPVLAQAQLEQSAFTATGRGGVATTFVTDYQCIGINPANLGIQKSFRDPRFTLGFHEWNLNLSSETLNGYELYTSMTSRQGAEFDYAQKSEAARRFTNKTFRSSSDYMWIGAHHIFKKAKIGVAFSMRDRTQLSVRLSRTIAELVFLGSNSSYFPNLVLNGDGRNDTLPNPRFINPDTVWSNEFQERVIGGFYRAGDTVGSPLSFAQALNGTRVTSSWVREFNFAFGAQLIDSYNFSLYAGLGVKYMLGYLLIGIESQNDRFTQSDVALSPSFGLSVDNSVARPKAASQLGRLVTPQPIGQGVGLDFGLTMTIKRRVNLAVAINNLGSINWSTDTYSIRNDSLTAFQGIGLNDYNILRASPETFSFVGGGSPFKFDRQTSRVIGLPTIARFGASYEYYQLFHIGFDIAVPLNSLSGNILAPIWAFGGDYRLFKTIRLSSGFSLFGSQSSKLNIPLGVTYMARKARWEAGLATQDVSSLVASIGTGSVISIAGGLFRLKF